METRDDIVATSSIAARMGEPNHRFQSDRVREMHHPSVLKAPPEFTAWLTRGVRCRGEDPSNDEARAIVPRLPLPSARVSDSSISSIDCPGIHIRVAHGSLSGGVQKDCCVVLCRARRCTALFQKTDRETNTRWDSANTVSWTEGRGTGRPPPGESVMSTHWGILP